MEGDNRAARARSFLLGGLVGASAVLAALLRRGAEHAPAATPPGLEAFEDAPCYRERVANEMGEPSTSEPRRRPAPAVRSRS